MKIKIAEIALFLWLKLLRFLENCGIIILDYNVFTVFIYAEMGIEK